MFVLEPMEDGTIPVVFVNSYSLVDVDEFPLYDPVHVARYGAPDASSARINLMRVIGVEPRYLEDKYVQNIFIAGAELAWPQRQPFTDEF